ncbi:hypothetical protein SNEBB_003800 [Seison nebaliae]|nr:hypothetical protein SNEBB_003800 [Seison nebaliae]
MKSKCSMTKKNLTISIILLIIVLVFGGAIIYFVVDYIISSNNDSSPIEIIWKKDTCSNSKENRKDTSFPFCFDPIKESDRSTLRIVGGVQAKKSQFPYLVRLHMKKAKSKVTNSCSGVIIGKRMIISAAHCFSSYTSLKELEITFGNGEEYFENHLGVNNVIVHECYTMKTNENDIALINLNEDIKFTSSISPICVDEQKNHQNFSYIISGWGYTTTRKIELPNRVYFTEISAISSVDCKNLFKKNQVQSGTWLNEDTQFCAGRPNRDSCKGDSGGPLVINNGTYALLLGIVSFGDSQCRGFGVYTKVASYLQWIRINQ